MRVALAAAVLAVLAVLGGVAGAFDHRIHERDLAVSGADDLPCTRCHQQNRGLLVGRPDHASCFGSCHGPAPTRSGVKRGAKLVIAGERRALCTSCHAPAVLDAPLAAKVPATYPPYVADDFAIVVGHKRHRELGCEQCHASRKGQPATTPPHRRCRGCHDGSGAPGRGPTMTACLGCHTPGGGDPMPPSLAEPTNTVTSTFSHELHAARGELGAACATCHAAIRDTDDNVLPRPVAAACALGGCHDGKPAFAITASCTRCHTRAPAGRYEITRRFDVRFSHAAPHHADAKLACATCHPLGQTGEVLVSGHAPCAACHADEFGKRDPTICFACHNATEPWRPLVADRHPPERTEFGANLDHGAHPGACTTCHSLRTARAQLRPPRGHRACTTAGCHAVVGGPAPQLGDCARCHVPGLAEDRAARRGAAVWSVRARFDHASHTRTSPDATHPEGAELACTSCHDDLSAPSVASLATPRKQTCVPCHDGTTAFKVTGTGCTRCHPGAAR